MKMHVMKKTHALIQLVLHTTYLLIPFSHRCFSCSKCLSLGSRETNGESERESFQLLAGFSPNGHNSRDCARSELGAWNSSQVSHLGREYPSRHHRLPASALAGGWLSCWLSCVAHGSKGLPQTSCVILALQAVSSGLPSYCLLFCSL